MNRSNRLARCALVGIPALLAVTAAVLVFHDRSQERLNAELFTAVREFDATAVAQLLHAGANVNAREHTSGAGSLLEYLRAAVRRMRAHSRVTTAATPLIALYESGDAYQPRHRSALSRVASVLIDHGADPTVHRGYGYTPLCMAIVAGDVTVAQQMLARPGVATPAVLNAPNIGPKVTPFTAACYDDAAAPLLRDMIAHGADLNGRATGWPGLNAAAMGHHLESMRTLLSCGADPNARDRDGNVALHSIYALPVLAPFTVEAIQLLLDHGADPDIRDHRGQTVDAFVPSGRDRLRILNMLHGARQRLESARRATTAGRHR